MGREQKRAFWQVSLQALLQLQDPVTLQLVRSLLNVDRAQAIPLESLCFWFISLLFCVQHSFVLGKGSVSSANICVPCISSNTHLCILGISDSSSRSMGSMIFA